MQISGDFSRFLDDPCVEPGFSREPLSDEVDVAIVGAGFSGLLAGARLREAGLENIRVIEAGGDFGGTWYWNRYPGVQCDIESYIYLPLLEELNYIPKEKYSYGPEIWEHSQAIGRHYDLYRNACFRTQVSELHWDEDSARWTVLHRPRGSHAGALRLPGDRTAEPAQAARNSRDRGLRRALVPHQPLGLRVHWRGHERKSDPPRGQAPWA